MNDQFQHMLDELIEQIRGAARFRWHAMGVAWAVCVVGWVAVTLQPDIYESQARVYVDTRTALSPVIQGLAISQDVDAQINRVRQSLLGRPQLLRLAQEAGLDAGVSTPEAIDRLLTQIRRDIRLDGRDSSGGAIYTVGYQSPDRDRSLKVVTLLVNSFMQQARGGKREGTETAQVFLRQQIQETEARLHTAEGQLADFKRRNVGQMPGAQGDYFTRLQAAMQAVDKTRAQVAIATTRRAELQRQLRGESSTGSANGFSTIDPSAETNQRIREMEARLAELLLRYTDKHPEVLAARENLTQLQLRRSSENDAFRRGDPSALASNSASANPVIQKIQQSLNDTVVELAALNGQLVSSERDVAQLRRVVDTVPQVEADYASLNRDYDVTRSQYNSLVERLEKTNLGEQAESSESIRFELIDPPSASFKPATPNRPILLSGVLALALGAGLGLAYLLHLLKPTFHSGKALSAVTGLPVLGIVSMTWIERYRAKRMGGYALQGGLLVLLIVLYAVVLKLQPVLVPLGRHV